jgi:two-component system, NtrC family, response regulator AtoC
MWMDDIRSPNQRLLHFIFILSLRGVVVCQGLRILAITRDANTCEIVTKSFSSEGHTVRCIERFDQQSSTVLRQEWWDHLLVDASHLEEVESFLGEASDPRQEANKIHLISELGDRRCRALAEKWNMAGVLTRPLFPNDFARIIAKPKAVEQVSTAKVAQRCDGIAGANGYLLHELDNHGFFLAGCPAMLRMHEEIRILASVDFPILILGESGSGKEIVARLLHSYSSRANKGFFNVNTAAIPSELLESELFGYEPGAFTGAVKAKPGKFELADKGTLLLDEIGEMSLQMQAKLLHVLQDGTFSRLGARQSMRMDVRVLAATNVNMEDAIAEKRFREDLYYRLNAFTITVPSLRERREEIPALMSQMMLRGFASTGREPQVLSSRLLEAAMEYHWPGNLRELRNFVTRLIVLQDQDAQYEILRAKTKAFVASGGGHDAVQPMETAAPAIMTLKGVVNDQKHETERRMIKEALSASGWNRRRAAVSLQISYRALLYKIQQHNLTV